MPHDPQFDIFGMQQTASPRELLALRKRELRNLLTSYADEADVFAEIIQNAIDAVVSAHDRRLYKPPLQARLDIVIGRRTGDPHYLLVSDNGVGMTPQIARRFTMPGFTSSKALGRTIGYKGVGASFFFAASNHVAFTTSDHAGHQTAATVKGSFRWIMNNSEPLPESASGFTPPTNASRFLLHDRGTIVFYEFHDRLKPRSLTHIVKHADEPTRELRRWASYLCAKTAIGLVDSRHDFPVRIGLHLDRGAELYSTEWSLGSFDLDDFTLGYPYPWRVFKVHANVTDIDSTPPSQHFVKHKGKHQALRLHWEKRHLLEDRQLDWTFEEKEVLTEHFAFLDVFFSSSTEVMKEVHKRTGARANVLRYGIRMACDGIPQGRIVDFDLTRHQGLARQAHALVAFDGLELDTGRKIPANEVVMSVVRKVTVRAMSHLVPYRWALKKKARPDPSPDIAGWRNETKDRSSGSIVRRLFQVLGKDAPIQVDPGTEQDVIALFVALLSRGVLKGYEVVALSGFNQYDGLMNILTEGKELGDDMDPLSIRNQEGGRGGDLKVVEFKLLFEALLEDFESRRKRPDDINLLVCWKLPKMNVRRGSLSYTYGDKNDFRETYGMTHLWVDENDTSSIPIVCLQHVVTERLKTIEVERGDPAVGVSEFAKLLRRDREAAI